MKNYDFPAGFLWGAATSSHQVEGGNKNDWTEWEASGHIKNRQRSGQAADHWRRFEQDFDLLSELNLNAYRLSIEWSRVEPAPGQFDEKAIDHYRQMLAALEARGIEPVVTLHHFTNPLWASDWTDPAIVKHFTRYVRQMVKALGQPVHWWCTINEPNILVSMGYLQGKWPPGHKSLLAAWRARRHLVNAHRQAYAAIHEIYENHGWPTPAVSMAYNLQYFEPASASPLDKLAALVAHYFTNRSVLTKTLGSLDFIGLNYYFANRVSLIPPRLAGGLDEVNGQRLPHTDLGWTVYPQGLYHVLNWLKGFDLPVMITENGLADARDTLRAQFIVDHLREVSRAISEGADVRGYLHWSLIDNFEWLDGYDGQFGLVAVDFKTQERSIRDSAKVYGRIAAQNSLDDAGERP